MIKTLSVLFLSVFIAGLSSAREIIPQDSSIKTRVDVDFFLIEIETPGTAAPFWSGSENSTRIVTFSVSSNVPKLSLISNIGTDIEKRITISPKNFISNRTVKPVPPNKLMLFSANHEIGIVQLFTERGKINTHKAIYKIPKHKLKLLGDSFLVVVGNPKVHLSKTKLENK